MPASKIPDKFLCSITQQIMSDPVVTVDGHVYEREAIEGWLENKNTSPNTNLPLETKKLIPVHALKHMIREFLEKHQSLHSQGRVYVPKAQKKELHKKMFDAICSDSSQKVLRLLKEGIDVESCEDDGKTSLIIAVENKRPEIVKLLIKHKACVGVRSSKNFAPLHVAVNKDLREMAEILLDSNACINSQGGSSMLTPLCMAVKKNNKDMVQLLLRRKAFVNADQGDGQTPLHIASGEGLYDMAKMLIDHKADLEHLTNNDETPLHLATAFNKPEVARLLYQSKADISATNHIGNPLHYAISEKHVGLTKMILEWKVDIEAQDRDGDAPLALAAMKGFNIAVELLLKAGANIEAKSKEDRTALHHASSQGHAHLVDLLLDHGAPINSQTVYGQTPLNRASVKGRLEVTKLLIERKADFELPDRWGATPLFRAARNNRKDIVKFLIKAGADMDKGISEGHNGDDKDNTPLHTAAWRGHLDVVEVLLNNWADYTLVNERDLTAAETVPDERAEIAEHIMSFQEKQQRSCPVLVRRMQERISEHKIEISSLKSQMKTLECKIEDLTNRLGQKRVAVEESNNSNEKGPETRTRKRRKVAKSSRIMK